MTDNFSLGQNAASCGINPPQNCGETMQKYRANNHRQETHFVNMTGDDNEFEKSDLKQERSVKNEPKKGPSVTENQNGTFWTLCPYCYYIYEYEKKYEECCLLCQNCRKGFHGLVVAPPPLVKGKEGEYYSGYGFFPLSYSGKSFFGVKKEVGGKDTGEKRVVVEISDDSDGKEEMHVKNVASKVKVEGSNNGGKRGMVKRVKMVPRNTKKMMGRGVKGRVEKVNFVEKNEYFGNGVADSAGGIGLGSGSGQNDCNADDLMFFEGDDDLMFFEGDDDVFVGLKDIF